MVVAICLSEQLFTSSDDPCWACAFGASPIYGSIWHSPVEGESAAFP